MTRLPSQRSGGALAEGLDDAGDLAAGDRGQFGRRAPGPGRPSRRAVSSRCTPAAATAIRTWPGPGSGSVDLLVGEVLGRAEGVQTDGVHVGSPWGVLGARGVVARCLRAPASDLKRA